MTDILAWSLLPAEIDSAVLYLVLGSASAMLFSMAKTGFGGGVSLLAVPVMVYACGGKARLATGILLPMLIAADYLAVGVWRGRWDARAVGVLLPGSAVGVLLGWVGLWSFHRLFGGAGRDATDAVLKLAIGAITLAFVALQVVRTLRRRPLTVRPAFWQATCIGVLAGLTSMLAHAAGAVVAIYLLSQSMPKQRYVATTAVFFWVVNQVKLGPYVHLGWIGWSTLGACVVLLPAVAAGAGLGVFLHRRTPQKHFGAVVYSLLALAGADMIRKAAMDLAGP